MRIDLREAHIWDLTGVATIDRIILKFRQQGATVEVEGLNEASATIMDKFAVHDRPDALTKVTAH